MGDRLVVIRTADLGADKQASYLEIPVEKPTLLWVIGEIRLSLDRKNLFKNPDPCHLPCELVWQSGDDVPYDLFGRGNG